MKRRIKIYFLLSLALLFYANFALANCKDPELREKVTQTAKEEGVNENELLSIIAHESRCHYFVIAWNLPKQASTAKSKFFKSSAEAKEFAESLIATKQYRVDVGIGQINNEAHIQPKGWNLEEVLNPDSALKKVAQVLKERTWANYHSSNLFLSQKWKQRALIALKQTLHPLQKVDLLAPNIKNIVRREPSLLLVFNVVTSVPDYQKMKILKNQNNRFVFYQK